MGRRADAQIADAIPVEVLRDREPDAEARHRRFEAVVGPARYQRVAHLLGGPILGRFAQDVQEFPRRGELEDRDAGRDPRPVDPLTGCSDDEFGCSITVEITDRERSTESVPGEGADELADHASMFRRQNKHAASLIQCAPRGRSHQLSAPIAVEIGSPEELLSEQLTGNGTRETLDTFPRHAAVDLHGSRMQGSGAVERRANREIRHSVAVPVASESECHPEAIRTGGVAEQLAEELRLRPTNREQRDFARLRLFLFLARTPAFRRGRANSKLRCSVTIDIPHQGEARAEFVGTAEVTSVLEHFVRLRRAQQNLAERLAESMRLARRADRVVLKTVAVEIGCSDR